jgi:hypothetical protein
MSSSIQMDGWREGNGKFDRRDQRLMTVQDVEKETVGRLCTDVRSSGIQGDPCISATRLSWCGMISIEAGWVLAGLWIIFGCGWSPREDARAGWLELELPRGSRAIIVDCRSYIQIA